MAKKDEGWTEVSAGVSQFWDKEGTVQGVLIEKVESQGQYNTSLYTLKNGNETIGVNGTTVIDSKLRHLELGTEVRITALGEAKSEKSGRTYQDFKVEYRETPFKEAKEVKKVSDDLKEDEIPLDEEISGDDTPL